jgi:DNA-binding NarL/FixJ family response regulator
MMYQQLGNRDAAFALLEEEYEQTLAWGAPNAVGRLQRVRGQLTEGAAGIALLRESAETLRASGNLVELFHTMRQLDERLDDDAISRQVQSLRLQCGLSVGATERATPTDAAAPTAELTKSEQRVVALAVTGLSNQQIADELSVSLRAVEKHLTKSYRKLQVSGRSELRRASLKAN